MRCQSLLDVIPAFTLDFREYVLEVLLAHEREQARFAVGGAVGPEAAGSRGFDAPGR